MGLSLAIPVAEHKSGPAWEGSIKCSPIYIPAQRRYGHSLNVCKADPPSKSKMADSGFQIGRKCFLLADGENMDLWIRLGLNGLI